ncbi:2-hydroxy-3-oxopropionate reductase [Acrocarpospora phusangensis]|uniref:2-hydroxy-3-oxopropionate reductase n=1 Tax=Acrocarpospora phusangensis TaxID=1070424 RepID=A0A919QB54_9ACTN|nr:NAD(P)-dependent oxidoreductase [Acrocarpospora phusangensis]GIH24148.1 2-hydroxy-3-oxopropionate reductase [Acrocarpospora phusangensis]
MTAALTTVGFVGLGNMGLPMASRLAAAGYRVRAYDIAVTSAPGIDVRPDVTEVAEDAGAVVLMLPDSDAVESVLYGAGLLAALAPGTIVIDMGSSQPLRTRDLAARAAERNVRLVDAPVSGGVKGAADGTLTVMAGGEPGDVARVRPILETLGGRVLRLGPAGSGHALKALNNLMSATHLLITAEALLAGERFGLEPETMLAAVNGSSGRSGSTENKWPNFVLPGTFDSGFALRLMLKDMRIAVELVEATGVPPRLGGAAVALWADAADHLPPAADHTEIVRRVRRPDDRS